MSYFLTFKLCFFPKLPDSGQKRVKLLLAKQEVNCNSVTAKSKLHFSWKKVLIQYWLNQCTNDPIEIYVWLTNFENYFTLN